MLVAPAGIAMPSQKLETSYKQMSTKSNTYFAKLFPVEEFLITKLVEALLLIDELRESVWLFPLQKYLFANTYLIQHRIEIGSRIFQSLPYLKT